MDQVPAPGNRAPHEPGAWRAGPAARLTFFAAQHRHRRASWRYSALCALAVLVMGIAVSIALSPLVILFEALLARLLSLFVPLPNVV